MSPQSSELVWEKISRNVELQESVDEMSEDHQSHYACPRGNTDIHTKFYCNPSKS